MVYAKYTTFEIGNESSKYVLKISGVSGNVSSLNAFDHNNNRKFSTFDTDNDNHSGENCSKTHGSVGWWYVDCAYTNLNGVYKFRTIGDQRGEITWDIANNLDPVFVEMMFRRNI